MSGMIRMTKMEQWVPLSFLAPDDHSGTGLPMARSDPVIHVVLVMTVAVRSSHSGAKSAISNGSPRCG